MLENVRIPEPLIPKNINELLSIKNTDPYSMLYAGGTWLLRHYKYRSWPNVHYVVYLGNVRELDYITRTERYIEFGACATLARILQTGKNVLPAALYQAMNDIGSSAVRNQATIGGNLCVPERRMTLFPVLLQMDVRIEIRKHGKSRWVPVQKFITHEGLPDIESDEIVTRIRIPFNNWNRQVYFSLGKGIVPAGEELNFCGLCNLEKGLITDLRMSFGSTGQFVFRNSEIESSFVGETVPLQARKLDVISEILHENELLENHFSAFQKQQIRRIMNWFLQSLD